MTKTFRKPDLNAPRYRPNRLNLLNKKFCNEFREANPETTLTDDQIKQIVYEYNGLLWETALQCRDGVELPEGLGHIFIGCCPPKKTKNIDFARSRELGVTVQHQNWETDGTVGKIFYSNFESANKFRFHELWGFSAAKQFRQAMTANYKKFWNRYVKVDNLLKVSRLFRFEKHKENVQKKTEELIQHYNEFDLD